MYTMIIGTVYSPDGTLDTETFADADGVETFDDPIALRETARILVSQRGPEYPVVMQCDIVAADGTLWKRIERPTRRRARVSMYPAW